VTTTRRQQPSPRAAAPPAVPSAGVGCVGTPRSGVLASLRDAGPRGVNPQRGGSEPSHEPEIERVLALLVSFFVTALAEERSPRVNEQGSLGRALFTSPASLSCWNKDTGCRSSSSPPPSTTGIFCAWRNLFVLAGIAGRRARYRQGNSFLLFSNRFGLFPPFFKPVWTLSFFFLNRFGLFPSFFKPVWTLSFFF